VKNYCRTCKEQTSLHEKGVCPWCDTPLTEKTGRRGGFTDDQLRVLRALHDRGYTVTRIAKANYEAWGYASAASCQRVIYVGWKRLGINGWSKDRPVLDLGKVVVAGRVIGSEPARTGK
jgi:hypothetical protein